MRALAPAFDHGKCLLICPFFIVTTFSRLFLFFPNHIFIKNINRPPKQKGRAPANWRHPLQCFEALESLLLLEAGLTANTAWKAPTV